MDNNISEKTPTAPLNLQLDSRAALRKSILLNPILHILVIAVIAFLAYSNTFKAPFHFDDSIFITDNLTIRDLDSFIRLLADSSTFSDPKGNRYMGFLTFALNYRANGLDVFGYHVVNFTIHVINALLVYWIVILTFQTPLFRRPALLDQTGNWGQHARLIAFFSAILFVSHPIQTQAVTYVSQRFASLAAMFYLFSLTLYVRSRISMKNTGRHALYGLSIICALFAMKTKEISFTLPVMITLYELLFFEGKLTRRLLRLVPLILTMLIIPLGLVGADKPIGDMIGDVNETTRVQTSMSRWDYLFTQFRVIVTYLRLLFFPLGQNLDYDYPVYHSFVTPDVLLSFLLLLSISSLGVYFFYRSRSAGKTSVPELRVVSFGIIWFFLALSVESSLVPIVDVLFEHRMYLPIVGIIISLVTFLFILADRYPGISSRAVISILSVAVIALASLTYSRNFVWQSDTSLWRDVVDKSPYKPRGYVNLGLAYKKEHLIGDALKMYNIAIAMDPMLPYGYINRGIIYHDSLQYEKAIDDFTRAIASDPGSAESYNNRGTVYSDLGDYDRAAADYSKAISLKPSFVEAIVNLGNAYDNTGKPYAAIDQYNRAIAINPDYEGSYYNRGVTCRRLGRAEALSDFQKSCAMGNKRGCEMSRLFIQ